MSEFLTALWDTTTAMGPWLLVGAAVAGVLHVLVPRNFMQRHFTGTAGVFKSVAFGVPLPLCSCGVIPAGIGLKRSGADDGASVAFLISTPQTGVDSIMVAAGMLGWPFALWKVGAAAVTGVVGGLWVAGRGPTGKTMEPSASPADQIGERRGVAAGVAHSVEVLQTIWRWVAFGIVISAALTAFIPAGGLASIGLDSPFVAVVAALFLSLPLYVCATASVPIAAALVMGGLPLGAALVFLMAGPATNVATIGAIHRAFGRGVMLRYLATIVVGSIAFALLFEGLFSASDVAAAMHHEHGAHWLELAGGGALVVLLGWFLVDDVGQWFSARRAKAAPAATDFVVEGMTCNGCARKVRGAVEGIEGVEGCDIDVESGSASVTGKARVDDVVAAITAAGFTARRRTTG